MIQKEPEKKAERELTCLSNTAGPDGCNHRQQIVLPQTTAQALRLKKLIQSHVGCITRRNRQLAGLIESENVGHQADKFGSDQVDPLSEQCIQIVTVVFEILSVIADAEAHLCFLHWDAKLRHKTQKIGIVAVIAYDEAGVDFIDAGGRLDRNRVGVATDIVVRLEYRDVVLTREQIGAGQS